jgi:ABC-type spermidine/putrescine transport system permease subunit II
MRKSPLERLVDWALALLTLLTFIVLYTPVIISAIFSVVPTDRRGIHWDQATFAWYADLLQNQSVLSAVTTTFIVGVIAVIIATLLSIAIALYVEWEGARFRQFVELVVYLPFLMPPIITGLALLIFFDAIGVHRGISTITIGHSALVMAVLYRLVLTRLRATPKTLMEASADLGASRWQSFRYVLWPQLRPAVITGAVLAMTVSFDETLMTVFLAGDTTTLPLRLWGMMRVGFTPQINALVTIVLAVSIALAIFASLRLNPKGEADNS